MSVDPKKIARLITEDPDLFLEGAWDTPQHIAYKVEQATEAATRLNGWDFNHMAREQKEALFGPINGDYEIDPGDEFEDDTAEDTLAVSFYSKEVGEVWASQIEADRVTWQKWIDHDTHKPCIRFIAYFYYPDHPKAK